jgi:hypothetical protein
MEKIPVKVSGEKDGRECIGVRKKFWWRVCPREITITEVVAKTLGRARADPLILGEAITPRLIGPAFRTAWRRRPYNIGTGATLCHWLKTPPAVSLRFCLRRVNAWTNGIEQTLQRIDADIDLRMLCLVEQLGE